MRSEERAGADGFGEDQHIPRLHAVLAQNFRGIVVDQAVHREAERQLLALARVAAHKRAVRVVQHFERAGHHLEQHVLHFGFEPRWHRRNRRRGLCLRTHRPNVAECVVRGDLTEDVGIVNERAEKVHRMHHRFTRRHAHHRCVVRVFQTDDDVIAIYWMQIAQRAGKHGRAHLCAAATATHGDRRNGL